jgi:4-alpha-glucanotransferase
MHPSENPDNSARASGVLLHITSLPSAHGCGDLGPLAREFATRLADAGQHFWQVLPLNPTTGSAGDSPYFSISAQAANPLMISLEDLVAEGLLKADEVPASASGVTRSADFDRARALKSPLLELATRRHRDAGSDAAFDQFCRDQACWLDDHALFTALRGSDERGWSHWPEDIRRRETNALDAARDRLADAIDREKRIQYLFSRQWQRLREHCAKLDIQLFGDMPIYVNYDSADVWANSSVFKLDDGLRPIAESGVPPDYFSATGQLWRNPVYDWSRLQASNFDWWVTRIATQLARFDLLRIDHFRGLVQYWEVPAGAETAIGGHWEDVPGRALFDTLRSRIDPLPVVAEDLGTITPDVIELRDHYGLPGMIVLQFAFGDDHHDNPYIPRNHRENAVAYLGTHDNNTTRGWLEKDLDGASRARLGAYLREGDVDEQVRDLIDLLLSSPARIAIVCAQDLLCLPASARMNTPGQETGNWHWQLTAEQFDALPLTWLAQRCRAQGR